MITPDSIAGTSPVQPTTEALERVFGSSATLISAGQEEVANGCQMMSDGMVQNPVVMVGLMVVFVCYALLLLFYGGYVRGISKIVFGSNMGTKLSDEISLLFLRAMRLFALLSVVMWALVGVRVLQWQGVEGVAEVPNGSLAIVLCLAILAILALQRLSTQLICSLTRRYALGEGLSLLTTALLALTAVVATPLALLVVANTGALATMLIIALLTIASMALLCYVIKTFVFFVEQKISILLWILYLCAVVLLPMGIAATTLLQNSSL